MQGEKPTDAVSSMSTGPSRTALWVGEMSTDVGFQAETHTWTEKFTSNISHHKAHENDNRGEVLKWLGFNDFNKKVWQAERQAIQFANVN